MKILPILCMLLLSQSMGNVLAQDTTNLDTDAPAYLLMDQVYQKILNEYPVTVDPDELLLNGIYGLLKTIDPFSYYLTKEEAEWFNQNLSGVYGGLGVSIGVREDGYYVRSLIPGGPASRSGMPVGAAILKVDGVEVPGLSLDELIDHLLGVPGTTVAVEIYDPYGKRIRTMELMREEVKIPAVSYCGMVNNDIAYLALARESEDCSKEVLEALTTLYETQPFTSLILDLRNNSGGYMKEAKLIANLFLEKGTLLLGEQDRDTSNYHYAINDPVFPDLPLVVLINGNTVSSGEILAGALQDHDRAVFIGQPTFGKGMMQNIFDMNDGSQLVLTIAYYTTPSGRSIQAYDYQDGNASLIADSLRTVYKTAAGRIVYNYGGITPDIVTRQPDSNALVTALLNNNLIFDFATDYVSRYPHRSSTEIFHLENDDFQEFLEYVDSMDLDYHTPLDSAWEELTRQIRSEGLEMEFAEAMDQLQLVMAANQNKTRFYRNQEQIRQELEAEIAYRYSAESGRYQVLWRYDDELRKALDVLSDLDRYHDILMGTD